MTVRPLSPTIVSPWLRATPPTLYSGTALALLALALSACPADDDPPVNNDGCDGAWYVDFLGDTEPFAGDLGCFDGSIANTPPAAEHQVNVGLDGTCVDHQSSDGAPDIDVEVYFNNDHTGTPDLTFGCDGAGMAPAGNDVPACQPISYTTTRDGNDPARPTLVQHKVWDVADDPLQYDFRSVAVSTTNLITSPLFYGVEIEEGKGMLFGKAIGCNFEALVNAQIVIRDDECRVDPDMLVGYTTNELPDVFARATTEDGFYFGINVPAGSWTVEMYRQIDDGFEFLGSTPATVEPDGVTLVDVFIGRTDGQVIPEACQ